MQPEHPEHPEQPATNNRHLSLRYAGMAIQWIAVLLLAVFLGKKADSWLHLSKPVFVWVLPVIGIIGMLTSVIIDTKPRKKNNH